ncbi:MAG: hypothetical protein LBG15_15995, partial [Dysgonamonadaceae bacterium]|nr:hypothetical protein [Dysgonamonadaceae bacterium]
ESDCYTELVKHATDETFQITKNDLQLNFLNIVADEIEKKNINLPLSELATLIRDENFSAKQDFVDIIVQKFTANITAQIENAHKQRTANKAGADVTGSKLYRQTKNDLEQIKSLLGAESLKYSNIADKLAHEILQCSIDYFNHYKDSAIDPGDIVRILAKKAQSLAVGDIAKQRCKENIEAIQEWIDDAPEREKQKKIKSPLDGLLATLQLFDSKIETIANAKALINQAKPDLNRIRLILGSSDGLYLKLSTSVAVQAQQYIIKEVNSAQEDIEIKVIISRYQTIDNLKTVFKNAWEATLLVGTLDMDMDFKNNSYYPNKKTLQELCGQLGISTIESSPLILPTMPRVEQPPISSTKPRVEQSNSVNKSPTSSTKPHVEQSNSVNKSPTSSTKPRVEQSNSVNKSPTPSTKHHVKRNNSEFNNELRWGCLIFIIIMILLAITIPQIRPVSILIIIIAIANSRYI